MRANWTVIALCLLLAVPASGARRGRHRPKAKAAPAVSRAQMELAHEMVSDSYAIGKRLTDNAVLPAAGARSELRQRVALLTRLLYTMRPEVMAEEKRQWAEELFGLAQELPGDGTGAGSGNAALPGGLSSTFANRGQIWATREWGTRDEAIATAAVRVAVYDPERALELLDTLPSEGGRREDARTMASRLVFAMYMQHHGAAGAQTLLAHARKWGEHGGFPYEASAAALARLRPDEDAAEDFFRQELAVFARGQEGVFGVREFAGLLDRAVALEAISDESAEEAGQAVVAQLGRLAGIEASGSDGGMKGAAASDAAGQPRAELTGEEQRQVAEALNEVRLSAPKAYDKARKDWPGLFAAPGGAGSDGYAATKAAGNATLPAAGAGSGNAALPAAGAGVDAGLQESFGELAVAIRERSGPEVLREVIARGLQRVNARYKAGECADCLRPDAQSWALVSLAAYASPLTIAAQLKAIEEPFWRAYFLAIAAAQVGEPTRVADPTDRRVPGKEEAEPEE
ncbi:MAG: hypothetical protein WA532_13045 [Candidatus Korobacteraceae bacterium]